MNPAMLGMFLAFGVFLLLAAKRSGERTEQARQQAATLATKAVAEEASAALLGKLPKPTTTTYKPKGQNMPKPVFLPSPAESLLEEDPVIPWQPVQLNDEGVMDWEKTDASSVYMNPATGELIEYGHK